MPFGEMFVSTLSFVTVTLSETTKGMENTKDKFKAVLCFFFFFLPLALSGRLTAVSHMFLRSLEVSFTRRGTFAFPQPHLVAVF